MCDTAGHGESTVCILIATKILHVSTGMFTAADVYRNLLMAVVEYGLWFKGRTL